MSIPLAVYLAAVVGAWLTVVATVPLWRKLCLHIGLVDDPGHRKLHDQPVPLAGGLAVMTGLLVPTSLAALLLWWQSANEGFIIVSSSASQETAVFSPLDRRSAYLLQYGLSQRAVELAAIFIGAFGMLILGLLDDRHELRPRVKFGGQVLIAAMVAIAGVRITLFVPSIIFSYAVTILWILTVVNAFNFIDNMNGLCAGVGAIGSAYFATIAATNDQYLVALIAFLIFGALLGFLPFNFPRARAFLGDAGSHLIGYLLAVLAILPHFYTARHPRRWAVLIPLLVLAVPLIDMVWIVSYRWFIGQPFYQADTNHLSHHLVRAGLNPTRAVLLIWLAAALIGGLVYLC